MISLRKIAKAYDTGDSRLQVLKDFDLEIKEGEFVSVMGSSGSGKSTLLNILGILDSYDEGEYHLAGELIDNPPERKAAKIRNRLIGFVFQSFNLLPFKTAQENVALPLQYQGVPRRRREKIAAETLERVGLGDRMRHFPREMSGGQRQRVAVARALVTDPEVLFADEPTGNLDTTTSHEVMDLFRDINRRGKTVIIVTHEEDIAERTHRVIHLRDGKIVD